MGASFSCSSSGPYLLIGMAFVYLIELAIISRPLIDLIQIFKLIFAVGYSGELAKHFEELLYVGLLELDPVGCLFLVVVVDDLLELFELGVVVDEERVDGQQIVLLLDGVLLPLHQPYPILQGGGLWTHH